MQDFQGKVAVITGGASGIGRALADRAATEGMRVVLADIEERALHHAESELRDTGAAVLAVQTDVSKLEDVQRLAEQTVEAFGGAHLLFNNAGVGAGTTVWQSTLADWERVLGANLRGVIYGVHVFVPIMLRQGAPAHIVNTASIAGLIDGPGLGPYKVTKHGVVSPSETLYHELVAAGAPIGVSVLCPAWVKTRIMDSERNRPEEFLNDPAEVSFSPAMQAGVEFVRQAVEMGLPPAQVADQVFDAIRHEQFYILTHPESKLWVKRRADRIVQGRQPTDQ